MEFFSSSRNGDGSSGQSEIVVAGTSTTLFPGLQQDILYVALGKDSREGETVLKWALVNSQGKKICILHIHKPSERIPSGLAMLQRSMVNERIVEEHDDKQRQKMQLMLNSYVLACEKAGVEATKLSKESSCVEKGIVELITEHEIKWLVMGAAANRSFNRRMRGPKSKKANYIQTEAPSFCHIWFVCNGNLICTRASKPNPVAVESPSFQENPSTSSTPQRGVGSSHVYHRAHSANSYMSPFSPDSEWERRSTHRSSSVFSKIEDELMALSLVSLYHENSLQLSKEMDALTSYCRCFKQEDENDGLYERLQQFASEAETYKKEAYDESIKRKKAEKETIEAIRRVKAAEAQHYEKVRSLEETLSKSRQDTESARLKLVGVMNELKIAQELKLSLENRVAESDRTVEELEQKIYSAVDLLQKYKKERDELQIERDEALREAEMLKKASSSQLFLEFSYSEIKEATNNFSPSCKIGEGGFGRVYLANLRHTKVAIKMLNPWSSQGPVQFLQEVNILSKMRHPNIVPLMGACPEACALICEYIPGGNLEDRLKCKGNTPPLTWKTRIRIASEMCSALIFLHSCVPRAVAHGDLKPPNVLLDAHCVSKLCDFGISRELSRDENDTTRCFWLDQAMGTHAYVAPEVLEFGELTTRSDIYSFGVILLRLLTGKPAKGIRNEIQTALRNGNLKDVLDPTAGDWPFVRAEQLANLAIRCTDSNKKNRPSLDSEVWRVLEPMKALCGTSISDELPSYFSCPIFQEIMREPMVAGDGFTYESEAIKGWLENGHNTSPTTGLILPHVELVPNHALRSAIQEWLQRRQ